jgi:RNA polymerase sigma-70 factor, ECF subfamily
MDRRVPGVRLVIDGIVNREGTLEDASSSLLVRIRAGDEGAWQRLTRLYEPLVDHWCRLSGLQEEDAAEVCQDVFRTAAESIADIRSGQKGESFRGWLRDTTRGRVLDRLRRKHRLAQGPGGSEAPGRPGGTPDSLSEPGTSDEADKLILIRRALDMVLAECEESTRRAFLRLVISEEQPSDVAQDLGMTADAVYVAKSQVLRRIREEFAEVVDL